MGRTTKYTSAVRKKITEAIKMGATYEIAAGYAGISYELFRQWMKDPAKVAFLVAVKEAEAQAAMIWLAKIEKAAARNWQAAAWKLERRYPNDYGRTIQQVEQSGTVTVNHGFNSDDPEAAAIARALISRLGSSGVPDASGPGVAGE